MVFLEAISQTHQGRHGMVFFFLLLLMEYNASLKLMELRVPPHLPFGARAQLSCSWQLGSSDVLYSVKWYKDGKEFFRYVPKDKEPRRNFSLPGVMVEESDLLGENVTLLPATLETSGWYRCEISGEKPLFRTVTEHAHLEVIVMPDQGPKMSGLLPRYRVGDRIKVNCTSGKSLPASQLTWYINGEPAPIEAVRLPEHHEDIDGLKVTRLELDFTTQEKHFKGNTLKVKCLSTLSPYYWKSNEESALKERGLQYKDLEVRSTQIIRAKTRSHRNRTSSGTMINLSYFISILIYLAILVFK